MPRFGDSSSSWCTRRRRRPWCRPRRRPRNRPSLRRRYLHQPRHGRPCLLRSLRRRRHPQRRSCRRATSLLISHYRWSQRRYRRRHCRPWRWTRPRPRRRWRQLLASYRQWSPASQPRTQARCHARSRARARTTTKSVSSGWLEAALQSLPATSPDQATAHDYRRAEPCVTTVRDSRRRRSELVAAARLNRLTGHPVTLSGSQERHHGGDVRGLAKASGSSPSSYPGGSPPTPHFSRGGRYRATSCRWARGWPRAEVLFESAAVACRYHWLRFAETSGSFQPPGGASSWVAPGPQVCGAYS
jgi:hypothetical protein